MTTNEPLTVALAQRVPVWLQKQATLDVVLESMAQAADEHAGLIVFGEAFVPGYPHWLPHTGGAEWDAPLQKELYAHYAAQAVSIEAGDLNAVCSLAKEKNLAVYLGIIERPADRGSHSLYCSLVYVDENGIIRSVHRKLQPTFDERLVWAPGDGHGLQVHPLGDFTVGGLNCWENWMPLPRATLYGLGENVHIAVWPGSVHNTKDITRFIARESRSYAISVSTLLNRNQIPDSVPHVETLKKALPEVLSNGGSCVAGPDGEWLMEPVADEEGIFYQELNLNRVREERQNFDPSGHYSRPDVTSLQVNRKRQSVITIHDE